MRTPRYCRAREKGRADRTSVELGGRRYYPGGWGSEASREKYHRLVAEWLASDGRFGLAGGARASSEITICELASARTPAHASPVSAGRAVRLVHDHGHAGNFAPLGEMTGDGVDDFVMTLGAKSLAYFAGRREWPEELDVEDPESYFAGFVVEEPGFGGFVAQVGDASGDGRPDVLVSGNNASLRTPIYLIYGADPGELPKDERIEDYLLRGGGVIFEWAGRSLVNLISMQVAGAGAGAGLADLLIGDQQGGVSNEGITYLIHGRRDVPPNVVLPARLDPLAIEGVVRFVGQRQSGVALGPAGDYNGDGRPDFTIGSWDRKQFPPGKIDLVFGSPDLPAELELGDLRRHGFRREGIHRGAFLVETAHVPGDLNGDGAGDFAFSEWRIESLNPPDDPDPSTGSVHVVFGFPPPVDIVRGDADSDGELDITDAVYALSFLFLAATFPLCDDAADFDDLGSIELTDAVHLLNHLFLGGAAPPAPYIANGNHAVQNPAAVGGSGRSIRHVVLRLTALCPGRNSQRKDRRRTGMGPADPGGGNRFEEKPLPPHSTSIR